MEYFRADEPRVAGEGRATGVWSKAGARRYERQHLPPRQPRFGQQIDPMFCGGTEIATGEGAGEAGDVEENAGAALHIAATGLQRRRRV